MLSNSFRATCVTWRHRQKRAEDQTKVGRGWGRKVLYDERRPGDESYLPLGRSPSSFLQRTVGTGSPRASHLNSTLWSTNTTWLPGRRTKLGRSVSMKTKHKLKITEHRTAVLDSCFNYIKVPKSCSKYLGLVLYFQALKLSVQLKFKWNETHWKKPYWK